MVNAFFFLQIFLALLLIGLILLQGRGAGLSAAFGGGGETFRTRRGVEKLVFYATIAVAILFGLSLIASLLL
ncbi:MAG: Preprotein translocase, SecG subunit [candidate division CPR1 bacterium GW2011_GWC1_49_13]|uniref:Protein-export membrane protein SecG n=1 Tax=candidate division CPR1 bacterium GW2011_GWC1_49_13 TaxID=1618342 RepID=A0A0G1XT83_9BACT|nr:MAG: Preprotein translocase, SecG subunit [candidate division CPR1 bacterium GW2011_GWC1_49_13]